MWDEAPETDAGRSPLLTAAALGVWCVVWEAVGRAGAVSIVPPLSRVVASGVAVVTSAKFASAGKETPKKDIGMMAMSYGHVYVARVAFGAKDTQTVKAFQEAESWRGPSLIIAYSHCIAHGYDMANGASQQKLAVDSGVWPLYRFDPRRIPKGEAPLHLDYGKPKAKVADYLRNESRFRMVERADPARYKMFVEESQAAAERRYAVYEQLAGMTVPAFEPAAQPASPDAKEK